MIFNVTLRIEVINNSAIRYSTYDIPISYPLQLRLYFAPFPTYRQRSVKVIGNVILR